ncbi:hypothetical protein MAPG_09728 [Magnaporthiopsis poae ATCC 64411]|uniref:Uncharacterized protein n=1 Tax=Magnaporthiopsis poae (strain ATCC 64411 / 73-15) TaxID=644358 RepID=A0A0C4EAQ1_MAGP6|nr:hypothetical protein MAPG_09728 [Magnaporthiopsis poae ATCC 64411]
MSSTTPQRYPEYLAKSKVCLKGPGTPGPRYHHVLFVETNKQDRSPTKFHVVADTTSISGITYESRPSPGPEAEYGDSFHSKDLLGYTPPTDDKYFEQGRWDALLGSLPTPPRQKAFNAATCRTELVKAWEPQVQFYAPGKTRHVPWKRTKWTNNYAVPALREAGFVVVVDEDVAPVSVSGSGSAAESGPADSAATETIRFRRISFLTTATGEILG